LVDRNADVARNQYLLATSLNNLGIIQEHSGDLPSAKTNMEAAIAIMDALLARDAAVTEYRENLANYMASLARLQTALADLPAAQSTRERLVRVYEALASDDAPRSTYLSRLALAYRAVGRHADAKRLFEELLEAALATQPEGSEKRQLEKDPSLAPALEPHVIPRLVQLYMDWEKPEKADEWKARTSQP
jgi:tetratricopeptide (TPR) repeat protein